MKELVLDAIVSATDQELTPHLLCAMLARHLCGQGDAVADIPPADIPGRLFFQPGESILEVWFKDRIPHPDHRFSRYRCVSFRPFSVFPSPPSGISWKIAVGLPPAVLLYTAAPLSRLDECETLPRLVVADGKVVSYESLSLRQMGRLEQIYAVVDADMARSLHCALHLEAGIDHHNHYAALQEELEAMLASCFPRAQRASGDSLYVSPILSEVSSARMWRIAYEHRLLLFNESSEGDDPLREFPRYGAFMIPAYRHTRLVMLYPQGELKAAQCFSDGLSPLRSLIGLNLMKIEKNWIEYRLDDDTLDSIYQALYHLKTQCDGATDVLLCYVSPSATDAVRARQMHLAANIRRLCRFHGFSLLPPVPLHAIHHPAMNLLVAGMASRLLAERGCFSWMPRSFTTRDTDLIIGLSLLHPQPGMDFLCGGTFYFNLKNFYGCRKVLKKSLFLPQFFSLLKDSAGRFCDDHGGCLPQRIVIYCYRGVEMELLQPLADWLLRSRVEIPVVLAFVRLTAGSHPLFYDPQSPCRMPADGTCISLGDDRYQLFCNDYRPDTHQEPSRYPFPLEVCLKRLMPGGELRSLEAEEARGLLVQAYQLTCVTSGRLDRSTLPVVVSDADRLARWQQAENEAVAASRIDNAAGNDDVAMCQKTSPLAPHP